MSTTTIVWNLQVTLDRNVAMPGEMVHVSFTINNPLPAHIFVERIAWNTSCFPVEQAVVTDVRKAVAPSQTEYLCDGWIQVPEVPDEQYQIDVVLRTHVFSSIQDQWLELGDVPLLEPRRFLVVHAPRFRAFVSRSLRSEHRPVAETMLPVIQSWGFDTHTVGVNELEEEAARVSSRVLEEIVKADCLFGIATPRDISATSTLVRTFEWLNSEASFAFAARKPLVIFADRSITLGGVLASPTLPMLRFDSADLPAFLPVLNGVMPLIRQAVQQDVLGRLIEEARRAEAVVAYGAFVAGRIQGQLPR